MHYTNQLQMRAMYSYINANIPSSAWAVCPKYLHLVERANERKYDTSIVTKVIIKGIMQHFDYFNSRVKERRHSIAFIYGQLTVIGIVFRKENNQLGFSFRTCFYAEKVTQSVIHKMIVR